MLEAIETFAVFELFVLIPLFVGDFERVYLLNEAGDVFWHHSQESSFVKRKTLCSIGLNVLFDALHHVDNLLPDILDSSPVVSLPFKSILLLFDEDVGELVSHALDFLNHLLKLADDVLFEIDVSNYHRFLRY